MTIFISIFVVVWLLLGILGLARFNAFDKSLDGKHLTLKTVLLFVFLGGLPGLIVGITYYSKDQKLFDFKFKR